MLSQAVGVTVNKGSAKSESYNVVRFMGIINFAVGGEFAHQRAAFSWAIGRLNEQGQFEPARVAGMSGRKIYNNAAPGHAFATLLSKSPTLAAIQDQVFADLEADGSIPAGTQRDYSLFPPGYVPPKP